MCLQRGYFEYSSWSRIKNVSCSWWSTSQTGSLWDVRGKVQDKCKCIHQNVFVVVQSPSCVQLLTLCDPMDCSMQSLPCRSTFLYSSWGSHGKYAGVVCHSIQWMTFCQNCPLWPVCLGWPCVTWLIVSLSYSSPFAMARQWSMKGTKMFTKCYIMNRILKLGTRGEEKMNMISNTTECSFGLVWVFRLHRTACRTVVPWPGVESGPSGSESSES